MLLYLSVRKKYKVSSILIFNRIWSFRKATYSTFIIVRLVSEIFANKIVITTYFGIEGVLSIIYQLR